MSLGELIYLLPIIKQMLILASYLVIGMAFLAFFAYYIARRAFRYHKSVNETIARMERAVKQVKEVTGGK